MRNDEHKAKTQNQSQVRIELADPVRRAMCDLLNQQLANLADLFSQTKHAHWNVKGPQFWSLHKLFDELAESVEEHADGVAERLTALGGIANGTVRMSAANSQIGEYPEGAFNGMNAVRAVADAFGVAANATRAGITTADEQGDDATADLLTQITRDLDESLYFLESHLRGE
jgi:starvation-inducible DNA-binding protein